MLGVYNKEKLAELVQLATGSYSINTFGHMSQISGSYLSRIISCKLEKAPSPEILLAIAEEAYNGITYEQMMRAAGHLPDPEEDKSIDALFTQDKKVGNMQKIEDLTNPDFQKKLDKMGFKIVSMKNPDDNTINDLEKLLRALRKAKKNANTK